jgi:hypothetical protein
MRHDVEFSIERAYSLGQIEIENSVKSTFNFQVCCETYNVFSATNSEKIRALKKMGHEIGLHFYANHLNKKNIDDLIISLHSQKKLLEAAIDIEISTFSFHRPKDWMLEIRKDQIGGMLNQYGKSFFEFSKEPKNIKYVADSRHSWDYGYPLDYIKKDRLQVLTHPDEWSLNGLNEANNFRLLKAELSSKISEAFLSESPRNFTQYKNQI